MSSSRHAPSRSTSTVAPPPLKIHPTAIVADKAQLTVIYPIEIGAGAVIHPYARLRSEYGGVIIGAGTSVAEKAVVGLTEPYAGKDRQGDARGEYTVTIAENVTVESGATVEAVYVGAHSTIEVRAVVGKGAKIGQWCKIAAKEEVKEYEEIEDYTVVFADGRHRIDRTVQEHKEVRTAKETVHNAMLDSVRGMISIATGKWTAGT